MSTIDTEPSEETAIVRPVVLYDGDCPLCRREIAHYRRIPGADAVTWLDIGSDPEQATRLGISPQQALARFHVRDRHGNWHTGAWGFAELWRHLPRYRVVSSALRAAHLLPLADRIYSRFARWRLRNRCNDSRCSIPVQTKPEGEQS